MATGARMAPTTMTASRRASETWRPSWPPSRSPWTLCWASPRAPTSPPCSARGPPGATPVPLRHSAALSCWRTTGPAGPSSGRSSSRRRCPCPCSSWRARQSQRPRTWYPPSSPWPRGRATRTATGHCPRTRRRPPRSSSACVPSSCSIALLEGNGAPRAQERAAAEEIESAGRRDGRARARFPPAALRCLKGSGAPKALKWRPRRSSTRMPSCSSEALLGGA
mmetsp:Transcript_103947/g.324025  ORF Transcript_103947/g.324025 Transcript_103947/m.324025 type:complete len:223 (-) Transcript_103947:115-783(-)